MSPEYLESRKAIRNRGPRPCKTCGTITTHYHRVCDACRAETARLAANTRGSSVCPLCGGKKKRGPSRCPSCRRASVHRRPDAVIDSVTPFDEDETARVIVAMQTRPMTLDEVGSLFDLTRERVRQIEQGALRKMQAALRLRRIHGSNDLGDLDR